MAPRRINPPRQAKTIALHRIRRIYLKKWPTIIPLIPRRTGLRPRVEGAVVGPGGRISKNLKGAEVVTLLRSLQRHKDTKCGRGATAITLGKHLLDQDKRSRAKGGIRRSGRGRGRRGH